MFVNEYYRPGAHLSFDPQQGPGIRDPKTPHYTFDYFSLDTI